MTQRLREEATRPCFVCGAPTFYWPGLCSDCFAWARHHKHTNRLGYGVRVINSLRRATPVGGNIQDLLDLSDETLLETKWLGPKALAWLRSVDDWPQRQSVPKQPAQAAQSAVTIMVSLTVTTQQIPQALESLRRMGVDIDQVKWSVSVPMPANYVPPTVTHG